MNEDSVFKPKKRIFMALTSISAVLGEMCIRDRKLVNTGVRMADKNNYKK